MFVDRVQLIILKSYASYDLCQVTALQFSTSFDVNDNDYITYRKVDKTLILKI